MEREASERKRTEEALKRADTVKTDNQNLVQTWSARKVRENALGGIRNRADNRDIKITTEDRHVPEEMVTYGLR
jgi:hypothetical protein